MRSTFGDTRRHRARWQTSGNRPGQRARARQLCGQPDELRTTDAGIGGAMGEAQPTSQPARRPGQVSAGRGAWRQPASAQARLGQTAGGEDTSGAGSGLRQRPSSTRSNGGRRERAKRSRGEEGAGPATQAAILCNAAGAVWSNIKQPKNNDASNQA